MSNNFPGKTVRTYLKDPLNVNKKRLQMKPTEENPLAALVASSSNDNNNKVEDNKNTIKDNNNNNNNNNNEIKQQQVEVISEENQIATEYVTFFRGKVPSSKISQINPLGMPVNEESLEILGTLRLWNHTLSMVEKYLKQKNLSIEQQLRCLSHRLAALVKLKRYEDAHDAIIDIHDIIESNMMNENDLIVPFNIRLLEAMLPHFRGETDKSIELLLQLYNSLYNEVRLARLHSNDSHELNISMRDALFAEYNTEQVEKVSQNNENNDNQKMDTKNTGIGSETINNHTKPVRSFSVESDLLNYGNEDTLKQDMKRATLQLVALYQHKQEYEICVALMTSIIEELPNDLHLRSYLGRILLQEGNLNSAQAIFCQVTERSIESGVPENIVHTEKCIYESLIYMAHGQFYKAYNLLDQYVDMNKLKELPSKISSTVVNNYAMAALYSNKIPKAVEVLELYISCDPIKNLNETLIFNLSTLYELSSTRPNNVKKQVLRKIIREYGPDDFDFSCLRI